MKTNNKKAPIKLLKKDTYLAMIVNAAGSRLWANNYGLVNGKKVDLVHNGAVSCAFFVSSILKLFDLIQSLHVTVTGTEKDLLTSNWRPIKISKNMPAGSIIIWDKALPSDPKEKYLGYHYHIGFYLGNEKAVSTWIFHEFPIIHHWTFNKKRKIIKAYYNDQLDNW